MDRSTTASSGSGFGASFSELVSRTEGLQPWRRVFHAVSGLVLALAPGALGLESTETAAILAVAAVLLFASDAFRLRSPAANRLFFVVFRTLASPREAAGLASSSWYALGAAIVWAAVPGEPAVAALLVLGLADPAASVVGRSWGRRPLGKGSWVGSITFAVVAFAVLLGVLPWPLAAVVAGVAAAFEVAPLGVDDNLTIPLVTGAFVWALQNLPPG
ncbi:diacylglycerol/polyprenol kinase family protein [Gaopeijia maritima]|uniref:diacylglycerol/polyprenol kinase family protein n=1 Tax=Gaopeijia maritima TaxID=3119007 RepID=UPI00386383EC